ncbi:MAG: DUF1624 domain-containing protein [Candidatus Aenigmarchaeota archaeon]|nr:DUF1624 domain-containing protein [Candidatus Aenigmarchaeota archaeon]
MRPARPSGGRPVPGQRSSPAAPAARLGEVDTARGVAIILMLISNLQFDLAYFAGFSFSPEWTVLARATAALFLLLVGVSLTLSRARGPRPGKFVKRGLRIFGYGLVVTAASWVAVGDSLILFGILHLIGIAIILSVPLLARPVAAAVAGVLVIIAGLATAWPTWLLWLGPATGYFSVDYTPLLPWWGVVLLGIAAGHTLFPGGRGRGTSDRFRALPLRVLAGLGRRSLLIYLIHQPIFLALITLVF